MIHDFQLFYFLEAIFALLMERADCRSDFPHEAEQYFLFFNEGIPQAIPLVSVEAALWL